MTASHDLPTRRLAAQRIARRARDPAEAVGWLGAVQAQDYLASVWAVGLRTRGATASTVERAIATGAIVRTHVFRGTLQYVARDDLRWMLGLVAGRVLAGMASRYEQLGLDERTLRRSEAVLADATRGGAQPTRAELATALQRAGIATDGQRLVHIIVRAELDAVLCSGARRGKQSTFAAFEARVPPAAEKSMSSALGELARRFFRSRGPATLRDFAWWTGLPARDARTAIAAVAGELRSERIDGVEHWSSDDARARPAELVAQLLPAFDEYLIGYADRGAVLRAEDVRAVNSGGGLLAPCVVIDGQVRGVWRRTLGRGGVSIDLALFAPVPRRARTAIREAAERYAAFVAAPLNRLTVT